MKTIKFLSIAALALVGAMMTGCSSDDFANNPQQPTKQDNIVTVTTTIGLGGNDDATNRALAIDYANTKLTKTFAVGDQVVLMYENTEWDAVKAVSEPLTAGDISADGKSAKLTFTLVNPREDSDVNFMYPAPLIGDDGLIDDSFYSQAGTLSDVASKDYAHWDGTLTGTTLPANVTLENQFSIIAFTLKDGKGTADTSDDTDITSTITGMTISAGAENYTVSRTAADGPIYVIMKTTAGATITITATDGTKNYTKTLTGKTYAKNNFYQSTLLMAEADPLATPLTIEALTAGSIVISSPKSGMQYSLNGGTKTAALTDYINLAVQAGDKVQLYGKGTEISNYYGTVISGDGTGFTCKVYGNIMSLIDETGFATKKTLTVTNVFNGLFYGNYALKDASGLLLPAETLADKCYYCMFQGCSNLVTGPDLPAMTLADNCYRQMFQDCSSLTAAPDLPAMTLADNCYNSMFRDCSNLVTGPDLPAMTLADNCYYRMFYGCSSLTAAPDLPAPTLVTNCYTQMFKYCSNLASVKCLATNISASNCTTDWLDGAGSGVAGTKNIYVVSTTTWSSGNSGIPTGWTRVNID